MKAALLQLPTSGPLRLAAEARQRAAIAQPGGLIAVAACAVAGAVAVGLGGGQSASLWSVAGGLWLGVGWSLVFRSRLGRWLIWIAVLGTLVAIAPYCTAANAEVVSKFILRVERLIALRRLLKVLALAVVDVAYVCKALCAKPAAQST